MQGTKPISTMDDRDNQLIQLMIDNIKNVFDEKFDNIAEALKEVIAEQRHTNGTVKELSFKAKQNEDEHRDIIGMQHANAEFNKLLDKRTQELEKAWERGKKRFDKVENDIECAKKKGIRFWLFISEHWTRVVLFIFPWVAFFLFLFLFVFSTSFQEKVVDVLIKLLLKGM